MGIVIGCKSLGLLGYLQIKRLYSLVTKYFSEIDRSFDQNLFKREMLFFKILIPLLNQLLIEFRQTVAFIQVQFIHTKCKDKPNIKYYFHVYSSNSTFIILSNINYIQKHFLRPKDFNFQI